MTIDWERCVHLDQRIDDTLLATLIPRILALRQQSGDPITLGINSPGGAVYVLDKLRSLVRAPDQDGKSCELITVVTDSAYSAAAMLLAMGDYAVALPHAEILFHDVRYGAVHDVTSSAAMDAARQLEAGNDRASLQIAEHMFPRWMWMYIDVHYQIDALREQMPALATEFDGLIGHLALPRCNSVRLDIAGLLLFAHKHLAVVNECIVNNALEKLSRWGAVSSFANRPVLGDPAVPESPAGILDGLNAIYKELHRDDEGLSDQDKQRDLSLFMCVLAAAIKGRTSVEALERSLQELLLFKGIENPRHWQTAMKLMLRHKAVFFTPEVSAKWDELSEEERSSIIDESFPLVRAVWLLCVMVARELFNGEHRLTPREALVLGLVDEVPGLKLFETRRAFDVAMAARPASAQAE